MVLEITEGQQGLVTPRYQLISKLGKGGMGEVYEAHDLRRDINVALKTLRVTDLEGVAMLKREFRAVAELHHPNLVRLYDLVALPDRCFFSMELVRGPDLLTYVRNMERSPIAPDTRQPVSGSPDTNAPIPSLPSKNRGTCDYERLRLVLPDILAGLDCLHRAGKVHRDLKPQNILVTPSGTAKILDFGILQERTDEEREAIGTPHYMAPEQALGRVVTPKADMYAFGCLLFVLLTGRVPFSGKTGRAILESHVLKPAPNPAEFSPDVPEEYQRLMQHLLAKEPRNRPNAREVLEFLCDSIGSPVPFLDTKQIWRGEAFVGRSQELVNICNEAREAQQHKPLLFVVSGESGIGKSHLVAEVVRLLEVDGWRSYQGRCYQREELPYKAFDRIAEQIAATLRRKPAEHVTPFIPEQGLKPLIKIFPALSRVRALSQRAQEEPELSPTEARVAAFEAFRDLLRRLQTEKPNVWVINDMQWADPESVALLQALFDGEDAPNLTIISTARTLELKNNKPVQTLFTELEKQGRAKHIDLKPFGAEDVAGLLELHLNEPASPELIEKVLKETGGNPYFAVEFANALSDPENQAEGPKARLLMRVGALPEDANEVLAAAVVAGAPFDFSLLRAVTKKTTAKLSEAIDLLLYEHFLRELMTQGDEDVLDVFHDRVREDVYEGLPEERRRQLHVAFAAALEETNAEAELAAQHRFRAGEKEAAAKLFLLAAKQAAEKLAFSRAADLYEQALAVGGKSIDRASALKSRGEALDLAGRYHDSARAYLDAAALTPEDRSHLTMLAATAELKCGELALSLQNFEEVLQDVDGSYATLWHMAPWAVGSLFFHLAIAQRRYSKLTGLASRIPTEKVRLRLDLYRRLGSYLTIMDRLRGGEFQARFLDLALREGSNSDVVYALYLITSFFSMRDGEGPLKNAHQALKKADSLAGSITDPEVLGFGEVLRGLLYWKSADWELSQTAFLRAEETLRSTGHGDTFERVMAETFVASADTYLGNPTASEERLYAMMQKAQRRHDRFALAFLAAPLAECRIYLGDFAGAQEALRPAEQWPKEPPTFLLLLSACAQARLLIAQGKLEEATRSLEALEANKGPNGLRFVAGKRAEIALLRATAHLGLAAQGKSPSYHRSQAQACLKRPLALPPKTFHANALRLRAIIDPTTAVQDLDRAVEILEACRTPIELCSALLQRGALRKRRALPGADADLARGQEILEETKTSDPAARDGFAWAWR